MPRTRTSFQKGHTGLGGRPPGRRNNPWRKYLKRAETAGARADAVQADLLKPQRLRAMTTQQLLRLLKTMRGAEAAHVTRSRHTRPIHIRRRPVVTHGFITPKGRRIFADFETGTWVDRHGMPIPDLAADFEAQTAAVSSVAPPATSDVALAKPVSGRAKPAAGQAPEQPVALGKRRPKN